uniref:MFS transporter n=1 Tax=Pseudactinotalea sp. TaxID=1926260 RepID=UPI003B3B9EB0
VLAIGAIPRALLMLPGGVVADRLDPRRLVIGTDTLRLLVMAAAAALGWMVGVLPVWLVAVSVLFGIADAFFLPAIGAMPPRLVDREHLTRLQAWRIAGLRVSNTVGPLAGAAAITLGAPGAFAAIATLFAISVALLVTVRLHRAGSVPTAVAAGPASSSIRFGWRQVRAHRLGRLLLATALSELPFSGPVSIGVVLLVQLRDWAPETVGIVLAAFSLAALLVTLLCAALPRRFFTGATVLVSLLAAGAMLPVVALAPTAWLVGATCAALGAVTSITMVACHGQVQQRTPPELLGRVTSILTLLTLGLAPLLYAASGIVIASLGIEVFFILMASFLIAAAVAWVMAPRGVPTAPAQA